MGSQMVGSLPTLSRLLEQIELELGMELKGRSRQGFREIQHLDLDDYQVHRLISIMLDIFPELLVPLTLEEGAMLSIADLHHLACAQHDRQPRQSDE